MGDMKTLHSVCVRVETPTLSDLTSLTIVECVNSLRLVVCEYSERCLWCELLSVFI